MLAGTALRLYLCLCPEARRISDSVSMDYFIDESGNTGDLARSDGGFAFGDQPIFSLAAVAVRDELSLMAEIERLRVRHGIHGNELKSSALTDRPEFVLDIIRYFCAGGHPYFLEVVDKKYLISCYITQGQLLPPAPGEPDDERLHDVRNVVADYLYERAPDEVFLKYLAACKVPSDATLRAQLEALLEFARSAPEDEVQSVAVYDGATSALDEYATALSDGKDKAYLKFLPVPDESKRGKPIWMLPNLSAFTNIYARINLYEKGNVSTVRLIHDEQVHFDDILQASKKTTESLRERADEVFTPHANFDFRESATLSFSRSADSMGLQVADVLAVFCMRYAKDFFARRKRPSQAAHETYNLLIQFTNPLNGVGINHVMSSGRALSLIVNEIRAWRS